LSRRARFEDCDDDHDGRVSAAAPKRQITKVQIPNKAPRDWKWILVFVISLAFGRLAFGNWKKDAFEAL
jgi:hypothetical protein